MVATQPDETDARPEDLTTAVRDVQDVHVDFDEWTGSDGDETFERIELVRTGLIRVTIAGRRFRLRRPFFGEFKQLRVALADVNDEISELSDEATVVSRAIVDAARDVKPDEMDPDAWRSWRRENREKSRTATRNLNETAEQLRVAWWDRMWDVLTLDGKPDDWPTWVIDPNLPIALVTHWRSSPLGRG